MFTRLALLDHFEDAPQLARLAQSAVALYPQEPNIVLIRLRQFGEAVLQYLAERWQLDTGGLDTPLDVLRLLDYKLLAPEKIIDTLNELRVKGNQAVHDLHEDPADAAANLQHAETVAQWLYDTFILPEQLIAERARREAEDQAAHAAAKERAALEAKDLAKFLAEEEKQAAKARKQAKREERRAERAIEKAERKAQIAAEKQQRVRQYEEKTRLRRARQQEYQRRVRRAEALYEEGKRFKAERDYANAVRCFSEAAEIGSARSMVQMGLAYSEGWQGEKDAKGVLLEQPRRQSGQCCWREQLGDLLYQGRGRRRRPRARHASLPSGGAGRLCHRPAQSGNPVPQGGTHQTQPETGYRLVQKSCRPRRAPVKLLAGQDFLASGRPGRGGQAYAPCRQTRSC